MNEDRDTEIKGEEGPDEGQLQSSQSLEEAVRRKYFEADLRLSHFACVKTI